MALPTKYKGKNHNVLLVAEPLLVDATGAARLCNVSKRFWHQLDQAGKVPTPVQKFGRRRLWSVAELNGWVEAGCPVRGKWEKVKNDNRG